LPQYHFAVEPNVFGRHNNNRRMRRARRIADAQAAAWHSIEMEQKGRSHERMRLSVGAEGYPVGKRTALA
jgi:hypothetical protein